MNYYELALVPLAIYALYAIELVLYLVTWYCLDTKRKFGFSRLGSKLTLTEPVYRYEDDKRDYLMVPRWSVKDGYRSCHNNDKDFLGGFLITVMPLVYTILTFALIELVLNAPTFVILVVSIFGIMTMIRLTTLKLKSVYKDLKQHKEDPNAHKE